MQTACEVCTCNACRKKRLVEAIRGSTLWNFLTQENSHGSVLATSDGKLIYLRSGSGGVSDWLA